MVDSVSKAQDNNTLSELASSALQENPQVAKSGAKTSDATKAPDGRPAYQDQADISEAAKSRLDAEKDVMTYARLASRLPEDVDHDKVNHFKAMLDAGRIDDYLRGIRDTDLADALLKSPAAGAFQ